jgi:Lrp/AsnC family transcriptional regulator for asnA, asnC and gidA
LELIDGVISVVAGVRRVTVSTTLETVKFSTTQAAVEDRPVDLRFPRPVVDIDETDTALIAALVADGRQSNREVARKLGVSESTVRVRLRRLEEAELLRITARTDPRRTGDVGAGAVVWIDAQGGTARNVARRVAEFPEAQIVALVAGEHDVLVGIGAPTQQDLVEFVIERIRRIPGARSTSTGVIVYSPWVEYQWARHLPEKREPTRRRAYR